MDVESELKEAKEFMTYTLFVNGDNCPSSGLGGCVKAGVRDAPAADGKILLME